MRTDAIAAAVGGEHRGPVAVVDGAAIDSRLVVPGQLFVAIVAERDGHEFAGAALDHGAAAVLSSRHDIDAPTRIVVPDTQAALLDLGRLARTHVPDCVVGVTGSVGKTTVKDLAAAALGAGLRTHANERSFNNELGVPLTLAGAPDAVEAVVVEMGARGRGHIALLCSVARPTVAVVTVVALAHAEMFGTIESVAAAKGELVEALPSDGAAVLNADDALVAAMAGRTTARVVRYGVETPGVDITAERVALDEALHVSFLLRSPWGDAEVRLGVRGLHQVGNALAAAGAALVAGVAVDRVAIGLGAAQPSPWRMALTTTTTGALVLNDAYNANPTSMVAALDALRALPATRRIAVLGVMAELGPDGDLEHQRIAAYADELGIEVLAVNAPDYARTTVPDIEAALAALGPIGDGDAVLVKGSRVAGLEQLAVALCA